MDNPVPLDANIGNGPVAQKRVLDNQVHFIDLKASTCPVMDRSVGRRSILLAPKKSGHSLCVVENILGVGRLADGSPVADDENCLTAPTWRRHGWPEFPGRSAQGSWPYGPPMAPLVVSPMCATSTSAPRPHHGQGPPLP